MSSNEQDLVIIGAGIMGLCTAYYACAMGKSVTVLEKSRIGNKEAASFGLTRSIRNDYLNQTYATLAYEARKLWLDLQRKSYEQFLVECGCLNIAKRAVTPNLKNSYAGKSYQTLKSVNIKVRKFSKDSLRDRFPQFDADMGSLDLEAGFLYLPVITKTLVGELKKNRVTLVENREIISIEKRSKTILIETNRGMFTAKKLVIEVGLWTNEVLRRIKGYTVQFPIRAERPVQCMYAIPKEEKRMIFSQDKLPVFAYLDVGIYGHPMYLGKTKGVKIGYYNPPNVKRKKTKIQSIEDFIIECMPKLADATLVDITDVDQCSYDMTRDGDFIVGQLPKLQSIYVAAGWNGTGYKFAPLIGKAMTQLAFQGRTEYDFTRFSPERFL